MKIKRIVFLVLIGVLILPIVLLAVVLVQKLIPHNGPSVYCVADIGGFVAEKLGEALQEPGCFYDADSEQFVFPGLEFGHDFVETETSLGLEKWFAKGDRLESQLDRMGTGWCNPILDYIVVNALGGVYHLSLDFAPKQKCYAVQLSSDIYLEDYPMDGSIVVNNVMSQREACDSLYGLYDSFQAEYGAPDEMEWDIDLYSLTAEEIAEAEPTMPALWPENYAIWRSGEPGDRTELILRGRMDVWTDKQGNPYIVMFISVAVQQEIEGVSFDEFPFA